jgi:hypothetical protein
VEQSADGQVEALGSNHFAIFKKFLDTDKYLYYNHNTMMEG